MSSFADCERTTSNIKLAPEFLQGFPSILTPTSSEVSLRACNPFIKRNLRHCPIEEFGAHENGRTVPVLREINWAVLDFGFNIRIFIAQIRNGTYACGYHDLFLN